MSNFILDRGDEAFTDAICSSLTKRGVDWADCSDEPVMQASNKDRYLILSSSTNSCDVNSKNFEKFLRDQKISKAFVLKTGASKFEIFENIPLVKSFNKFFILFSLVLSGDSLNGPSSQMNPFW